jgi:hypothetical protein
LYRHGMVCHSCLTAEIDAHRLAYRCSSHKGI